MRTRAPTVGAVEWFERGERTRVERVAWELRTLGIEHLRTGVSWAEWHVPGGAEWYSWLLPRLARDFELLPCVSYTPPSLAVVPSHTAPPRRLRDYADFLDMLVTDHGRCFSEVELWNALRARGTTVIASTSKQAALRQADRVVVLVDGQVAATGSWRDLARDWQHLAG